MQKFIIMTIVRLDGKQRTSKAVGIKTLPHKRKEPVRAGSNPEK